MNPHYERALILYQQSRYQLAETELRQALATDPESPEAHALLGLCLTEQDRYPEATQAAETAVGLGPDFPFAHFALARVLYDRKQMAMAETVIREAIQLDPYSPANFALLASIQMDRKHWQEALNSAEEGLRVDPEHVGCNNLRAMTLVKLGRREEAGVTMQAALEKDPDNELTHANLGWSLLEQGKPKEAMEHFREALRLDPNYEWARAGIVEALKAHHRLYRLFLTYAFWMARLSNRAQWMVILIGYFGYRILARVARDNDELRPWIMPVLILYILFVLLTWIANPLFNLLLRLNRFGRLALSQEQIVASNWVGGALFLALAGLGVGLVTGAVVALLVAAVCGLLVIPLSGVFTCSSGWPRQAMAAYTLILALLGTGGVVLFWLDVPQAEILGIMFLLGALLSSWVANGLGMVEPRR